MFDLKQLFSVRLGDQPEFFAYLHRLGSSLRAQLVEEPARMSLDGVFADEELFGDLAIAEAGRDQVKYLEFARCKP